GNLDEFGDPADAGDHRLVPFLEIDPWMAPERGRAGTRLRQSPLQRRHQRVGLAGHADQRAERADHVENAGDVALVEGMDRDVAADQPRAHVRLPASHAYTKAPPDTHD